MSRRNDPSANTAPLSVAYREIVTYHDREFQLYSINNSIHFAPVDEIEIERLNIQHRVLQHVFDDRLIFPPVTEPRRILDLGYGNGAWANEVAELYPTCQVVAVDISDHMKPDPPADNLYIQTDNLNERFTFPPNAFDVVHSQLVAGGINSDRWSSYLRDIFRTTKPGGWVQMVESYLNIQSDNGTLAPDNALSRWSSTYLRSLDGLKNLRIPLTLQNVVVSAGFTEVAQRVINLPTCAWPNESRENTIGRLNRENVQELLESLSIYPFTERLGMSIEDVKVLVDEARREAEDPKFKAYIPLYVCIGRKPLR